MARQDINVGGVPNDGSGDNLRVAGGKINNNFIELYQRFGGDSSSATVNFLGTDIVFSGLLEDSNTTTLTPEEPTNLNEIVVPDASGTIVLSSLSQTLTNKTLSNPVLSSPILQGGSHQYQFTTSSLDSDIVVTLPKLLADDTIVFKDAYQTLSNKTLNEASLSSCSIDYLEDINHGPMINFTATTNATNYFNFTNGDSINDVIINTIGADSDIDMNLVSSGAGTISVSSLTHGAQLITGNGSSNQYDNKSLYLMQKNTQLNFSVLVGRKSGETKHFMNIGSGATHLTFVDSCKHGTNPYILDSTGDTLSVMFDGTKWYEVASTSKIYSSDVHYDNSESGLSSTNVKTAIDELKSIIDTL